MARMNAQSVIAGVFIKLVEGGEVKDLADDLIERLFLFNEEDAVVNELACDVTDDVDS